MATSSHKKKTLRVMIFIILEDLFFTSIYSKQMPKQKKNDYYIPPELRSRGYSKT